MKRSKFETNCKIILEQIFKGYKFETIRPNWLKNPETNHNLEIDLYCEIDGEKLALEANGGFHVSYPNIFHNSLEEFLKTVRRDDYKRKICKIHGITLITIPYIGDFGELRKYIIKQLILLAKDLLRKRYTL